MPGAAVAVVPAAEILVVEDTPESMSLLTEVLSSAGYSVRQAQDGQMALATTRARPPDLILLDIAMPDIDGYDVCRRLKSDPATRDVPIIFCSALHDLEYKVQGFARGGVDFITKPFNPEEVLVRVRTHVELHRLRATLERRVEERTAALASAADSLRNEIETRKRLEKDLQLAAKAFDSSYSAIMITDRSGVILAVNPAFSRITGYSREEALGTTPRLIRSERHNAEFYRLLWRALGEQGTWTGEIWNRKKDGNVVPMMETITALKEEHSNGTFYVATLADLSESRDAQTLIKFLSHRDSLTGLANRLVARQQFGQAALSADQSGKKVAVLCFDLDRFKVINDSLGHAIGDQLLKAMAIRLSECVGEENTLSRDGGDEFLVIASNIDNPREAMQLAERLSKSISQEYSIDHHPLSVTTSVGIALYPNDGMNFDELLKNAGNALHSGKRKGGKECCLFTTKMATDASLRMQVETCLRNAVSNGELQLVYQPKKNLGSGCITGAEALVRWNSPVLGFVSPVNFIPLAEETGLILAIDEWVIAAVCRQIRQWCDAGLETIRVSVNLSTLQFRRGDLNALIRRVLADSGIDASCLDVEITEGALMENIDSAVPILEGLKKIGVSVSLDDFGTGYSSLSYLQKLPIDTLKIDKSFVDEIHAQSNGGMIARSVIALGHNLGLSVVAEGVEHQPQCDFLAEQGCDEIQGYLISKPVAAHDFASLFMAKKRTP